MFKEAVPSARAKFIELQARKAGILVELPKPEIKVPNLAASSGAQPSRPAPNRLTMADAIYRYLKFCEKQRSLRTFRTYRPALKIYFLTSYTKTYVDEVNRDDILRYISHCFESRPCRPVGIRQGRDRAYAPHGHKKLIESSDGPDYVETIRPVYEPEGIHAMLRHATPIEALLIKFFLASSFRNRETRFVAWYDIDFRNSIARVTAKPVWNFSRRTTRSARFLCRKR
jgi:integrase